VTGKRRAPAKQVLAAKLADVRAQFCAGHLEVDFLLLSRWGGSQHERKRGHTHAVDSTATGK
jgi:hypothetical protein